MNRVRGRGLGAAIVAVLLAVLGLGAPPAVAGAGEFITVWDTTRTSVDSTPSNTVRLPLESGGTYNFTIEWGDTNSETITDFADAVHTYAAPGEYEIKITGTLDGWSFGVNPGDVNEPNGDALKLLEVKEWGGMVLGDSGDNFRFASNLTSTALDSPDLTTTDNLSGTFFGASSLNGGVANWDTTAVTDMTNMFNGATQFNADISGWDTANVNDMAGMFDGAAAFNQDISGWQVGNVSNLSRTFAGASSFDQPIGLWDTSSVTEMVATFQDASSFNQDLSNWDTAGVSDMSRMFEGATIFNRPLSAWKTDSLQATIAMFRDAAAFNQPLGTWKMGLVNDATEMFAGAASFNQPLNAWNTSSIDSMASMFAGATSFNQPLNNWVTTNVGFMTDMFRNATAFNRDIGGWNTGNVDSMAGMFAGATGFNQDIGGWDTGKVTEMNGMFDGATAFDQDLGAWNVKDVTTMADMFSGVALSVANYDSLLTGWAAIVNLQDGVPFDAGNSKYSAAAAASRGVLTGTWNWAITDGGEARPGFSPAPASVAFGDQEAGTRSATRTVTVTNSGELPLTFGAGSVEITGTNAGQFEIDSENCSSTSVAPSGTCQVSILFAPTGAGARAANLRFVDNAPGSPQSVGLTGTGIVTPTPPAPTPTTSPTTPTPSPTTPTPPAPVSPSSVKQRATAKAVQASWKAVPGATSYSAKVTGKNKKNKKVSKSKTTTTTSVKVSVKLKKGSRYTLCVTARSSAGSSAPVCKKGKV